MAKRGRVAWAVLAALLVSLLAVPQSFSQAPLPPAGRGEVASVVKAEKAKGERGAHAKGELIVGFKAGAGVANLGKEGGKDKVRVKRNLRLKGYALVSVPEETNLETIAAELRRDPAVDTVDFNYVRSIDAFPADPPNDPLYSRQWNLTKVQAPQAWPVSSGQGIVVAVIDTGVAQAPDLAQTTFVAGYDFVNRDTDPTDDHGHGTHVAGTIAQSTNNALGVAGVAFGANIMPLKVLGADGNGLDSDVVEAIVWAADHGAKVINMSLGGADASSALFNALAYAYGKGVVIVAAAGNEGLDQVSYPAAYPQAIAVGAVDAGPTPVRAYYSNYGSALDLVAPGGDLGEDMSGPAGAGDGHPDGILQQTLNVFADCEGATPDGFAYCYLQGTSMATPHVAAAAAMILANGNATSPFAVKTALQSTARDLGTAGWDAEYGHGLVQIYDALQFDATGVPKNVYLPMVHKAPSSDTWTTITSEGFEGAFPPAGWLTVDNTGGTDGEYYWAKRNCASATGTYSAWAVGGGAQGSGLSCGAHYPNDAESWLVYGPFSLAGATAADFRLKAWLNSEVGFDGVLLGASINGSSFYFPTSLSGNSAGWIDMSLNLNNVGALGNLLGQPNVWVAVLFLSDSSDTFPVGVYVDDIVVRKCTNANCDGLTATTLEEAGSIPQGMVELPATERRLKD